MDKKEFLKALAVVGLINTAVVTILAGLIYLLVLAVVENPFMILTTLLLLVVGYVSAFIYLKFKEKK